MYEKLLLNDLKPCIPTDITLMCNNDAPNEELETFLDMNDPEMSLPGCIQNLSVVYTAEFKDEIVDTLTDLVLDGGVAPEEVLCYKGTIYPARIIPKEVPKEHKDYNVVLVLVTNYGIDNSECTLVTECDIYDSDIIKMYIETVCGNQSEFYGGTAIEDVFVFLGKSLTLKATAELEE